MWPAYPSRAGVRGTLAETLLVRAMRKYEAVARNGRSARVDVSGEPGSNRDTAIFRWWRAGLAGVWAASGGLLCPNDPAREWPSPPQRAARARSKCQPL